MRLKPIFRPVHDADIRRIGKSGAIAKRNQAGKADGQLDYSVAIAKPVAVKNDLIGAFARAIQQDKKLLDEMTDRSKQALEGAASEIQQGSEQYALQRQGTVQNLALSYEGPSRYIDHAVESTQQMSELIQEFYTAVDGGTDRFERARFLSAVVIEAVDPDTLSAPLKTLHKKLNAVGKVLVEDTKLLNNAWAETKRWRHDLIAMSHGSEWRAFTLPFTGATERSSLAVDADSTYELIGLTNVWQQNINAFLDILHKPKHKGYDSLLDGGRPLRERVADARGYVMDLKTRIGRRRRAAQASTLTDQQLSAQRQIEV